MDMGDIKLIKYVKEIQEIRDIEDNMYMKDTRIFEYQVLQEFKGYPCQFLQGFRNKYSKYINNHAILFNSLKVLEFWIA